jgi:hypothetical protein
VTAFSLHPGVIKTPLQRHMGFSAKVFNFLGGPFMKSAQQVRARAGQACMHACTAEPTAQPACLPRHGLQGAATAAPAQRHPRAAGVPAQCTQPSRLPPAARPNRPTCPPHLQGAATTIYAAVAPGLEAQSGAYLADCAPAQPKLPKDPEAASKLWAATEALLAEKFKG